MNLRNCQPMRLLKRVKKMGRDNFFDILDEIRDRHDEQPYWPPDMVYTPVNAVMNIAQREGINFMVPQNALTLYSIAALSGWRHAKNIYTFTPELTEVLYEQADRHKLTMSADTIRLPVWSVYIQPESGERLENMVLDGFFVHWDYAEEKLLLRFLGIGMNGSIGTPILLTIPDTESTIEDCIDESVRLMSSVPDGEDMFSNRQQLIHWISLVLYLAAVNADIRTEPRKKTTRRIQDVPQEIQTSAVGENVAVHLRTLRKTVSTGTGAPLDKKRRSPVMHLRRAHWHTYLTGSGRKKKILKWVLPTIVNQGVGATDSIAVTKIE